MRRGFAYRRELARGARHGRGEPMRSRRGNIDGVTATDRPSQGQQQARAEALPPLSVLFLVRD